MVLLALPTAEAGPLSFGAGDGQVTVRGAASDGEVVGRFLEFAGSLDPARARGELSLVVGSLTTGLGPRDARLRRYALEEASWSTIELRMEALQSERTLVSASGAGSCIGTLRVRDHTEAVAIPVTWAWEGENLRVRGRWEAAWATWGVPDPSVLLSRYAPSVVVDFDLLGRPTAPGAPRAP